ncbi:MAG TPA: hypothetical protein VMD59_05660, partial [Acidimicrobiales bacterium]|nr:hypothetical protein [Acidimicrobiales bacterium]
MEASETQRTPGAAPPARPAIQEAPPRVQPTNPHAGARRRRHRLELAAAAIALAGGIAAASVGVSAAGASGSSVVISTVKNAHLGTILVSRARTLYILKGNKSCTGSCLTYWPPVLLPKGERSAVAGSGVDASKLGVMARNGGKRQVT